MKRAIVLAIAITVALASSNASALGSKEEAVLQVFGGLFLLDKLTNRGHQHQAPPVRSNYHSYEYRDPYYGSEVDRAYRQGQLERERRQHRQAVDRAYECGYYGNC